MTILKKKNKKPDKLRKIKKVEIPPNKLPKITLINEYFFFRIIATNNNNKKSIQTFKINIKSTYI